MLVPAGSSARLAARTQESTPRVAAAATPASAPFIADVQAR